LPHFHFGFSVFGRGDQIIEGLERFSLIMHFVRQISSSGHN